MRCIYSKFIAFLVVLVLSVQEAHAMCKLILILKNETDEGEILFKSKEYPFVIQFDSRTHPNTDWLKSAPGTVLDFILGEKVSGIPRTLNGVLDRLTTLGLKADDFVIKGFPDFHKNKDPADANLPYATVYLNLDTVKNETAKDTTFKVEINLGMKGDQTNGKDMIFKWSENFRAPEYINFRFAESLIVEGKLIANGEGQGRRMSMAETILASAVAGIEGKEIANLYSTNPDVQDFIFSTTARISLANDAMREFINDVNNTILPQIMVKTSPVLQKKSDKLIELEAKKSLNSVEKEILRRQQADFEKRTKIAQDDANRFDKDLLFMDEYRKLGR